MAGAGRFDRPGEECDLVLKGGVASGIVYPQAVLTLAAKYRFRSIGGSSAGAIAAALAAAAEYGRAAGGFETLDDLRRGLLREGAIGDLFQPTDRTRPLWETVMRFLGAQPGGAWTPGIVVRRLANALPETAPRAYRRGMWCGALLGGALGLAIGLLLAFIVTGLWWLIAATTGAPPVTTALLLLLAAVSGVPVGVAGAWLGGRVGGLAGGVIALGNIALRDLPVQGFGICTGSTVQHDDPRALTDWLHARIAACAGRAASDPPLTYGELKRATTPEGAPVGITLRSVTTNLSQGRPYIFPPAETLFIFHAVEWRALFPPAVCDHLEAYHATVPGLVLPPGFHFLPPGDDLPVIVGTRLSLSLPLVLAAVRLYTLSDDARRRARAAEPATGAFHVKRTDLQPNWFTDGGIASNFPIQLFDAWLPTRPTFGIRLTARPDKREARPDAPVDPRHLSPRPVAVGAAARSAPAAPATVPSDDPTAPVYLPPARAAVPADWTAIAGMWDFLTALWDAARNYRDNTQSALASYRERIAQVRLGPQEGGLNLRMPASVLHGMDAKGAAAGAAFIGFYGDPAGPDAQADRRWQEHRWVRLRVLAAQLEQQFGRVEASHAARARVTDPAAYAPLLARVYADLLQEQLRSRGTDGEWYASADAAWSAEAESRLDALFALMDAWRLPDATPFFDTADAPHPHGLLRVAPEL